MKKIKITMLSVFLLIVILFLGETTYTRLEQNRTAQLYAINAEFVDKSNFAAALQGFDKCGIIYEYETVSPDLSRDIKVFYSGVSKDDVRDKLGLSAFRFNNLTVGECSYTLCDMSELTENELYDEVYVYCDGDEASVSELTDILGNNCKNASYSKPSGSNDYTFIFEIVWGIVIVLILAVTIYDIFSQYKSAAVSLVLGNSISETILKNIITDACAILGAFAVVSVLLSFFTAVNMNVMSIALHGGLLILLNSLCYLAFYKTNIFKALRDGEPCARLLKFNYILKAVSALGVIAAAVYCVSSLNEFKDDMTAYDNIKSLQGYSYFDLQPPLMEYETDEDFEKKKSLENECWELYDDIIDEYGSMTLSAQFLQPELMEKSRQLVIADEEAFDMLQSCLPELSEREGTFLFIPEDASEIEKERISDYIFDEGIQRISYKSADVFVLQSNSAQKFATVSDPVILYSSDMTAFEGLSLGTEKVIKINGEQYDELLKKYSDKPYIFERRDVFENYMHYQGSATVFAFILSLALVCAAVFELVLLISILTLEYKANAKEICLKKVLGIGMFERNKRLFILIALTDILGATVAFILLDKFGWGSSGNAPVTALILIAAELVITFIKASRIEKANTAKILKGGAL